MIKKTLLLGLAQIFFLVVGARALTYNMELSVGGNSTDFPAASKGFLIVDTAGDGFDFVTDNSTLLGKSESKASEKWGDDDLVMFADLSTEDFENQVRGFNILPTEISTDKWKEGDKLALVWFPDGTSTAGSKFSYYTSNQVEHESGTIPFEVSKNGDTDSIIALEVTPISGIISTSPSPSPSPSPATGGNSVGSSAGGGGGGSGGSSQVQKSKKSKGKSSSANKSGGGSKKSSAKKSKSGSSKKDKGSKSSGKKKSGGSKKSKK